MYVVPKAFGLLSRWRNFFRLLSQPFKQEAMARGAGSPAVVVTGECVCGDWQLAW